jgi:hypothetical protein
MNERNINKINSGASKPLSWDLIEQNTKHMNIKFEFWWLKSKHSVLNDWPINLIIPELNLFFIET